MNDNIQSMLAMADCILQPRSVVYVSGPISTGKKIEENPDLSMDERIKLGATELRKQVEYVRNKFPNEIVIDNTATDNYSCIKGVWQHDNYMNLWIPFISRYVKLIFFTPDWEYSKGCNMEFEVAKEARIPIHWLERIE